MSAKKSPTTKQNPETPVIPVRVLREATCNSLEGSATLHYKIGLDEAGEIQLKIEKNSGGGFFSAEWVAFNAIQEAFTDWPEDTPINSMALRPLFKGKSVNTPSFMLAVLTAEKLLEPMPKRKRVHRATDPAAFLATVDELKKDAGINPAAKPKAKPRAKAKPAVKAKTATRSSAKTAKTPRKTK